MSDRKRIRIRCNSMKVDTNQLPPKRNSSCSQMLDDGPKTAAYLDQVNKIMQQARETSSTLNLEFRKYSDKPQVQMIYVQPGKMQKRLQQMEARINVNQYQMLVEVKKDPIDKMATEKKVIKNQIEEKNYKAIFKECVKDQKLENTIQIFNNPLVAMYQFYDDQEKDWKETLKNKCLISRKIRKESEDRIRQSRTKKLQSEQDGLRSSQANYIFFNNNEDRKYEKMFQDFAQSNNMYQIPKPAPDPQTIVTDRFQTKFYRNRQRKFETLYDRFGEKQNGLPKTQATMRQTNPQSPFKKVKKLPVPPPCKKVFNTQNKLIQESASNGISQINLTKMIVQFNKTIMEMKPTQGKSRSLPKPTVFRETTTNTFRSVRKQT